MTEIVRRSSPWWGSFAVPESQSAAIDIGPLEIRVLRATREWTIAIERVVDAPDRVLVEIPAPWQEPAPSWRVSRVAAKKTHEILRVEPALPNRPLVVTPQPGYSIAAREMVVLHVRIPVWIRLSSGDPPALLREVSTVRMRETWSGSSPREGEIAYSSDENRFESPEERPPAAHMAICAVRVHNRAASYLPLEEIRIPLPQMSLYADVDGRLWTSAVNLEQVPDTDHAELLVDEGPPPEAKTSARIAEPRMQVERSRIVRLFGSLLRHSREDGP
jgi:hypothetical protein